MTMPPALAGGRSAAEPPGGSDHVFIAPSVDGYLGGIRLGYHQ